MRIEILCTGDEVLTGKIVNSNFSYVSQKLEDVGLSVIWGTTVGDDRAMLKDLLRDMAREAGGADTAEDASAAAVLALCTELGWEQLTPVRQTIVGQLTGLADASAVDDAASSASALAAASSATFEKSRRFRAASHSATRSISVSTARRRSEKTPVGAQTSVDPPSASASQARALSRKRWRRLTRVLVSLRHFWKWVSD